MKTRHAVKCLLSCIAVIRLTVPAGAESPDLAAAVGSYIDSQTVLVGRLDVQQFPLAELQERGLKLVKDLADTPQADSQIEAAAKQVSAVRDAFVMAGGREIFVLFSMSDARNPPLFVVTSSGSEATTALQKMIEGMLAGERPAMEVRRAGDNRLLVGVPAVLDRVQGMTAQPRPEFTEAFDAAKASLQLIIAPGADHHRVLKETFPQFPPPWQQLTGQTISDGIQWAVLDVEASPALKVRLLVQSKDEAAAQQLKQLTVTSLNQLAQLPQVRQIIPTAKELVALVQPVVNGTQVSVTLSEDANTVQAVMKPLADAIGAARHNARRMQSMNNLKQLALAMHNYHDVFKRFPPAASYDASGKPLLSWRVHILPYIDQVALYNQFKLDEPWDSQHNKKLIGMVVKVYEDPNAGLEPGMTTYLVPVGEGTVFGGKEALRNRDIVDGPSNTLMIVGATPDRAVPWTKPEDLPVTKEDPTTGLFDAAHHSFLAAFCDGSVHAISDAIDNGTLWQLFDAKDQKPIDPAKIR